MSDLTVAREALQQINPSVLEYNEWLAVGMALKDAGGSFAEWDQWSRKDAKRYREKEMQSKWDSFRRSGTSGRSIAGLWNDTGEQAGEALLDIVTAQSIHPRHALVARADQPRLAQDLEVVAQQVARNRHVRLQVTDARGAR